VKKVEKTDENVRKFYELISETTTRNSFSGNTFSYYKEFLKGIDNSELLLAYS
jgi:lipid II:glycine glycyltransferase (peptidoglycan interpeptide bridge formation enzyme)